MHNGRGVLIDLEYAKRMDSEADPHESATVSPSDRYETNTNHSRQGTRQFMSSEVVMQHHLYDRRKLTDPVAPPWRHNPLHDLDSVWWICIWHIYTLVQGGTDPSQHDTTAFHSLFSTYDDPTARRLIVSQSTLDLVDEYSPSYNTAIWPNLVEWRQDLTASFEALQRVKPVREVDVFPTAYTKACRRVQQIIALDTSVLDVSLTGLHQEH